MYLQLVQSTDFYVSDQIITVYVRMNIKMIIKCTLSWTKALISVQSADFYVSDQIIRTHWYQNDYNMYLELVQSADFYVSDQIITVYDALISEW
jgi:hypothetical protein